MQLIWFLMIGLVAGWLAGQLSKGHGFGIIGDMVVGIVGAVFGGFLFRLLGIYPDGGFLSQLVTATVGAVTLVSRASLNQPEADLKKEKPGRPYLP
jgi:uncharacterized membrane protein YeaQ/YmgE (transglycosylase-associated protein family)